MTRQLTRRPALLLALLLSLAACGEQAPQSGPEGEPPPKPARKNLLRVDMGQYAPGLTPQGFGEPNRVARELGEEWAEHHPGMQVEFPLMVYAGSGGGEYIKTQLIGGTAPDILQQNAEVVWQDVDKGWYVPLDDYLDQPNPYVPGNERWRDIFVNQALIDAKRAPDGKLYTVPIDIVETGCFYNKDILRECGWEEFPETWAEMLEMLGDVQEAGYIPLVSGMGMESDWGLDIIFEMLYHDILPELDLIASREDAADYLGHYLEAREAAFLMSKGFFTSRDPRWHEVYRLLGEWRKVMAVELKNTDPIRQFLTGRLAVYWTGSWFIRRMVQDPYIDFEWGVGYIPTITRESSRFASGTPATVIGGAAMQYHITNSALRKGTVEEAVDFLMFISAPQNVERLCGEALIFIPNIKGAEIDPRLEPFQDIFLRPYCAIKWLESMSGQFKNNWRRMLDYYLEDGMTLDEFLVFLDDNFEKYVDFTRTKARREFPRDLGRAAVKWLPGPEGGDAFERFVGDTLDAAQGRMDVFYALATERFPAWLDAQGLTPAQKARAAEAFPAALEESRDAAIWDFQKMEKVWTEREALLVNELDPAP